MKTQKWPAWLEDVFWSLFNAWQWIKNRIRPLTPEQRDANMRDLLQQEKD
jgi:hypothetical protein